MTRCSLAAATEPTIYIKMVIRNTYGWVNAASLFLARHLFGLHVDWNDQGSEGVATDDSTVVHNVLWCNFTVEVRK